MKRLRVRSYFGAVSTMLLGLMLIGCGGSSGVGRVELSGSVTHVGKPVPAGQVRFEPDRTRGGTGPVGFASIRDGKYNTRRNGKGPVAGPVTVLIRGYVSSAPGAPNLFPQYATVLNVSPGDNFADFDIPGGQ